MKKIIIAIIAILFVSINSFAQAVPVTKTNNATSKMKIVKKDAVAKTETKIIPISTATKPINTTTVSTKPVVVAKTTTTTKGLKKDGTIDKRFKNKAVSNSTTTGPLKKDGTPDMRYKANKKH